MKRFSLVSLLFVAACGTQPTISTDSQVEDKTNTPVTAPAAVAYTAEPAPAAPVQPEPAVVAAAAVPASFFSNTARCTNTVDGWAVTYDLATNPAGDHLIHVTLSDPNNPNIVASNVTKVWAASELYPSQGSSVAFARSGDDGVQYWMGYNPTSKAFFMGTVSNSSNGRTFYPNSCADTSGLPVVHGQAVNLSRIVHKVWCGKTTDVAYNQVYVGFEMAIDASGNVVSYSSIETRSASGNTSQVEYNASGTAPQTLVVKDATNGGQWTMGYDTKAFLWTTTFTDHNNASTVNSGNCLDWFPKL